jgi:hypothetical protein
MNRKKYRMMWDQMGKIAILNAHSTLSRERKNEKSAPEDRDAMVKPLVPEMRERGAFRPPGKPTHP